MRGKRGDRRVQIFSSLGCRETVLNDGTETTQIPNRKTTARRPNTKTRQQTQTLTQNMAKIGERICAQMIISLCKRLKDWQQNCRKKTGWSTANKLSKSQQVSQPIDKYYYQMVTVISTKNAQQLRQSRLQRQIKQTGNSFVPHEQYRRNIDTLCSATVLNGKFKRVQMTTLHSSQSLSHSITKKRSKFTKVIFSCNSRFTVFRYANQQQQQLLKAVEKDIGYRLVIAEELLEVLMIYYSNSNSSSSSGCSSNALSPFHSTTTL